MERGHLHGSHSFLNSQAVLDDRHYIQNRLSGYCLMRTLCSSFKLNRFRQDSKEHGPVICNEIGVRN